MFKKLLVPVDLTDLETSKSALARAVAMVKASSGELRLVYVMPYVPTAYLEYVPSDFEAGEKARVEKDLEALAKTLGEGLKVSTKVTNGGVYHAVLEEAEAYGADLILVGSHQPTLATYVIGSHATNIVRHAQCSVLVVRG